MRWILLLMLVGGCAAAPLANSPATAPPAVPASEALAFGLAAADLPREPREAFVHMGYERQQTEFTLRMEDRQDSWRGDQIDRRAVSRQLTIRTR